MEKNYVTFIEELRQMLLSATGMAEECIYFKEKDEYPPTTGDRLFLECSQNDDSKEVCALYVKELYDRYKKGALLTEICRDVIQEVRKVSQIGFLDKIKHIKEYERVKKDLFIRLLNVERNRNELKNAVYRVLGDIAFVLYLKIGEQDGCVTSMKIKEDVLNCWERECGKVFEDALLNTYFVSPPRIYCWEKMMFNYEYEGENFMSLLSEYKLNREAVGNCLSTSKRTNGAIAIFLPGVAQRIADLLEDSFYMVFTSIHEVMIHNDRFVDPEELRKVLAETVRDATPEEDFLTMYIYHYDRRTGLFSYS